MAKIGPKGGRPENLRPWKKGQSGNPSGRPKSIIAGHITAIANRKITEKEFKAFKSMGLNIERGVTYGEALAAALFRHAIKGKIDAAKEIGDRVDGKVRAQVEVTGEAGGPIEISVVFEDS